MMIRVIAIMTIAAMLSYSCERGADVMVSTSSDDSTGTVAAYDSLLAQRLEADDYGMAMYVMAILKKGPNRPTDEAKAAELQAAHMANIGRLAEEGKLLLAGPFGGDGDLRGIYIFDVKTVEEARALTETDPAIQAGSLVMELIPWYGSAGVRYIPELHERITKVSM